MLSRLTRRGVKPPQKRKTEQIREKKTRCKKGLIVRDRHAARNELLKINHSSILMHGMRKKSGRKDELRDVYAAQRNLPRPKTKKS